MNARPCKYCDNPVASNARRCPKCDGKNPYPFTKRDAAGALVVMVLIFGIPMLGHLLPKPAPKPIAQKTLEEVREERIEVLRKEWDRLRKENIEQARLGFKDFSANDRRIVQIVEEIARLEEEK